MIDFYNDLITCTASLLPPISEASRRQWPIIKEPLCCDQEGRQRADVDEMEGTGGEARPGNKEMQGKQRERSAFGGAGRRLCFAFDSCATARQDLCSRERNYGKKVSQEGSRQTLEMPTAIYEHELPPRHYQIILILAENQCVYVVVLPGWNQTSTQADSLFAHTDQQPPVTALETCSRSS